jgi:drug/metabolite transporter (DMT)-like permease
MLRGLNPLTLGVVMALGAYAVYSWADAVIKGLGGGELGIFEIGFFSTIFSLLPGLFARPRDEQWRDVFRFRNPRLIHLIAVMRVGASVFVTYSFITIPLADVYCIVFLIPVFITILSVAVLHEKVTLERWVLVLVSFLGVLLVVRPGFRELELGHLTALGCALCAAVATTCTRFISGSERRISLFLLPTLYTLLFNGAMLVTGFTLPSLADWAFLVLAGLLGGLGYILQIAAVTNAPASRVAPMQYSQIVWALILGALFFEEVPDALGLVGLGVIVASGLANIFADGARARISGRWAAYRARRDTTPDDASRITGPPEA